MQNDYGVYKTLSDGTLSWEVTEMPLTFGDAQNAINSYSMADAITVSAYLTQSQGEVFSFGRPGDRHGK